MGDAGERHFIPPLQPGVPRPFSDFEEGGEEVEGSSSSASSSSSSLGQKLLSWLSSPSVWVGLVFVAGVGYLSYKMDQGTGSQRGLRALKRQMRTMKGELDVDSEDFKSYVEEEFLNADQDKNGSIDFREMNIAMESVFSRYTRKIEKSQDGVDPSKYLRFPSQTKLHALFNKYDVNNNSRLDRFEFHNLMVHVMASVRKALERSMLDLELASAF